MDIPSAFTNPLPDLPIRTKTPEPCLELHGTSLFTPQLASPDSGYASGGASPVKPSAAYDSFDSCGSYTFDGSVADTAEYLFKRDEDNCPRSAFFTPEQKIVGLDASGLWASTIQSRSVKANGAKAASLCPPHRARSSLPSAFYSASLPRSTGRRSSDSLSSYLPKAANGSSIRIPDRFVHPRDAESGTFPLGEKFRLTKNADDLKPVEKILRSDLVSPDAFTDTIPHTNPVPTFADERQQVLDRAGRPIRTRIRTTLMPGQEDDDPESVFDQRLFRGSMWSVGTVPPAVGAFNNGHGSLTQTGTTAPFFTSNFTKKGRKTGQEFEKHAGRLAAALDFDRASRILQCDVDQSVVQLHSESALGLPKGASKPRPKTPKTAWNGAGWVNQCTDKKEPSKKKLEQGSECRPLRILSAPKFRDDFYCSLLAYSPTIDTLAVGLADLLYVWSEANGAVHLNGGNDAKIWLTSLAFSSEEGGKSILAFGRSNCVFGLMAISEANNARMVVEEASAISCLSWRPTCTMRPSKNPNNPGVMVRTEDLLVGTDSGVILYYVVEWPDKAQVEKDRWQGDITLVSQITVHDQQVCGLSWAPSGDSFATGGNDNGCCFFYVDDVLPRAFRPGGTGKLSDGQPRGSLYSDVADSVLTVKLSNGSEVRERVKGEDFVRRIASGHESWRWDHGAAVKAIAFCPWQDGLVATGGGSNDRCVRFFHTTSGTALATIFVSSQVTSLIWSTTRKEIAVTFGFAHPSHPIRIAVYSWPECKQVAAIPWEGKHRALYGISCSPSRRPVHPKDEDKAGARPHREGCIAVAASDESIKFYELWPSDDKPIIGGVGMLGGSDILEDIEGIIKEGDIIR